MISFFLLRYTDSTGKRIIKNALEKQKYRYEKQYVIIYTVINRKPWYRAYGMKL